MSKNAVALLFALASQAAWAGPYRALPRLPSARVKARAAAARNAQRVLARDASGPTLEPAERPPAAIADANRMAVTPTPTATSTPTPTAPATTIPIATTTPNPNPTSTAPTTIPIATTTPTAPPTTIPFAAATPAPAPMDASQVIVVPPPAPTRPGDGPLIIEVASTRSERGPVGSEPVDEAAGPIAASAAAENLPAVEVAAAPPPPVELAPVELVRARSGALIEILRDAQGRLVSARDARE
jgi:hypothetical protein